MVESQKEEVFGGLYEGQQWRMLIVDWGWGQIAQRIDVGSRSQYEKIDELEWEDVEAWLRELSDAGASE
jgi:hypothetical protein